MSGIEFSAGNARPLRDFPDHWGEPEGRQYSPERQAWITRSIEADEATGVPAGRRAQRMLEERAEKLSPSVREALVRIVRASGLGPKS